MLSFFGKVFLLLGAAFGLGAFAGRRARGDAAAPKTPAASPEPRMKPQLPSASPKPATTTPPATIVAAPAPVEATLPTSTVVPAAAASPEAPEPGKPAPVAGDSAPRKPSAAPREDPLAAKHRAAAFDRDFRTLDYRSLSKDEAVREKERRARRHSSWQARDPEAQKPSPPLQNAQFSHFGGSFVSAEVIRGRSSERVPDLMPSLPGESVPPPPPAAPRRRLAGPDPSGPTPKREQRTHLPEDPLVAKHRAAPFDRDFRTLDYRRLGSQPRPAPSPVANGAGPAGEGAGAAGDAVAGRAVFRIAGAAATVPVVDTEELPVAGGAGGPPAGGPGEARLAEEIVAREPARLEAPRAGTPDDLTRIDGIGPSLERLLFENGIYHYDQIARWSAGEAHWFEARSGFPGRVARERWIEQAQALVDDRATPRPPV